ncbi:MAG: RdgB/HAM1 family non-canonical purine NTP pyrophosphatase [Sphingomonadaceae bacterium]
MRRLLLSTNNPDKVREFAQILAGLPLEIVTPAQLGLKLEVTETGATFAENAALKARAFHEATGLLSLSDDSGLEVEALGGAPGVYSARYGGLPNGEAKNRLLLRQMEGVSWERRDCRYVCEIAIVDEEGRLRRCRGILKGKVALEPRGEGGFGFDPIFFVPSMGRTVAEMTTEEKNRISHRGKAGRCARRVIEQILAR